MITLVLALTLLRIYIGVLLIAHGTHLGLEPGKAAKLAGRLGMRPVALWGPLAWVNQVVGGALFALGLALPVAAALIMAPMIIAALMKRPNGFWDEGKGYEFPLHLALWTAIIALTGPGPYALDTALGLAAVTGRPVVIAVCLAGAVFGALFTWATRRVAAPQGSDATAGR